MLKIFIILKFYILFQRLFHEFSNQSITQSACKKNCNKIIESNIDLVIKLR